MLGLFILAVILLFGVFIYFSPDLCGNDIYKSLASPNGKLKVVIFERSCGATTGISTQISITSSDGDIGKDGGNIFSVDGEPKQLRPLVSWESDSKLNILVKKEAGKFKQETEWGWPWKKVEISYR